MEKKEPKLNEDELIKVSGGWEVGGQCPDCKAPLIQGPYGIQCSCCSWHETL